MNITAKQFDLSNACACAIASRDAYADPPLPTGAWIQAGETRCMVFAPTDEGPVIIAFRGTANIRNWITDAEFARKTIMEHDQGERVEVHCGFNQALNDILPHLTCHMRGSGYVSRPLFFTGHSLGGALAVLAALALDAQGFPVNQVYTFGQPRIGNAAFKRLYESTGLADKTFRVVYQEDIVPRVPHLPAWHDPYRHVGTEVFISSVASDLWFDPPLLRILASDAWGIYRAWCCAHFEAALDPIIDHRMENYTAALANLPAQ